MKKINYLILASAALAASESVRLLIMTFPDRDWLWFGGASLYLAAVVLAAWGMCLAKKWALRISWLLALGSLSFGTYMTHFKWTFWIFKEPALMDRVRSVTIDNIDGVLMLILSILWLLYFTRPKIREQFCS